MCASDVGADDVALDEIADGVLSEDDTAGAIARDQVAGRRTGTSCQAPDEVVRDAIIEIQANVWIGQSDCSGYIRANEVALHRVVRSAEQVNAAAVRRNDVTGVNGCAADEVVRAAVNNASVRISESQGAGHVGAD